MTNPRITYAPRGDASAELEVATLSNIYRFVLNRARKEAAPRQNRPDARKENPNASGNASISRAS